MRAILLAAMCGAWLTGGVAMAALTATGSPRALNQLDRACNMGAPAPGTPQVSACEQAQLEQSLRRAAQQNLPDATRHPDVPRSLY